MEDKLEQKRKIQTSRLFLHTQPKYSTSFINHDNQYLKSLQLLHVLFTNMADIMFVHVHVVHEKYVHARYLGLYKLCKNVHCWYEG